MSIIDEVTLRVREGRLFLVPTSTPVRAVLVTEPVWRFLNGPWQNETETTAGSESLALLEFIAGGGHVVVGSGKHRTCHFKELTMKAPRVWEVCTRAPKPGYRVFGMFAETGIFVGTNYADRLSLGTEKSREFKEEIRICKARWRSLFSGYEPKSGAIGEYVTGELTDARALK